MKRRSFLAGLTKGAAALPFVGGAASAHAAAPPSSNDTLDPGQQRALAQEWFQGARFGMFIHWGVYSVLGKGEWVMNNDEMTVEAYEKLPSQFNPTDYDPAAWVRLAKEAGMQYITITSTSKHHDGFAMWDSGVSDYNIVQATPYGQDVLKMLADECQKQDVKLFFYHSHFDWHHPDYYPRGRTGRHSGRPDQGSFDAYLDFMNAQIEELAGGAYGELAGFWFDGWWDQQLQGLDQPYAPGKATQVDWKLRETYELIHRLQPHALISNNHHVPPFPSEGFQIFERDLPGENTAGWNTSVISPLPLETADTINGAWGYNKKDDDYKSVGELVGYLVRAAGNNANLLLNVGPTPQGTIQPEFQERLHRVGRWLDRFGETIYGTRGGPVPEQRWGVSTQKEWTVYVHVLDSEAPETLALPGTGDVVFNEARHFETGERIPLIRSGNDDVEIRLPRSKRSALDTVVVLDVAG